MPETELTPLPSWSAHRLACLPLHPLGPTFTSASSCPLQPHIGWSWLTLTYLFLELWGLELAPLNLCSSECFRARLQHSWTITGDLYQPTPIYNVKHCKAAFSLPLTSPFHLLATDLQQRLLSVSQCNCFLMDCAGTAEISSFHTALITVRSRFNIHLRPTSPNLRKHTR